MYHGFYIEKQNVSHAFRLKKVTVPWIYIYIFLALLQNYKKDKQSD